MGGKLLFLPGEVLQTESREKKSEHRSNNELQEVSRGHSTKEKKGKGEGKKKKPWKGPNDRKSSVYFGKRPTW